jgi:predicted transport protein
MVSPMTFEDAAGALARFRGNPPNLNLAKADILTFLNRRDISEGPFGQDVKVILAAADFGLELTTTVLWLNEQGLDIRCVRMVPYRLENGPLLVDVEQIIPLPEASTFQTRLRAKERLDRSQGNLTAAEALERAPENVRNLWDRLQANILGLSGMSERQTQIYTAFDKGPNNPIISGRAFLGVRPQVKLWMKVNPDSLDLEAGFTRDIRQVGHWGVGDLEALVFDEASLDKAKVLFQRCYQEN